MKQRLFLLAKDESQALEGVRWLKKHVAEDQINVLARHDKKLISEEMPNADISTSSDVAGAAKRGAAIGGILFAGLTATIIPPIGALATAGVIAGGALLGTWSSTLIGISVPNENVEKFANDIDKGSVLIFADVSKKQWQTLESAIHEDKSVAAMFQSSELIEDEEALSAAHN